MFVEGLLGEELYRIRLEEYRREVTAGRRGDHGPIALARGNGTEVRRRVGNAIIRIGATLSSVDVDPCLDSSPESGSAHA